MSQENVEVVRRAFEAARRRGGLCALRPRIEIEDDPSVAMGNPVARPPRYIRALILWQVGY